MFEKYIKSFNSIQKEKLKFYKQRTMEEYFFLNKKKTHTPTIEAIDGR